jgi:uncharacterized protein
MQRRAMSAMWSAFGFCVCFWCGLVAVHARVRAQPVPQFDAAPAPSVPMNIDRAPSATINFSGNPISPEIRSQSMDSAEMDAKIARLRALATAPAVRGLRVAEAVNAAKMQANAAWILGLLYLHGAGVAASPAEAQKWFERANTLGEPLAVAGLAWCDIEGCKNAPDPALARRWLPALRKANAPRALYFQWLIEARLAPIQISTPKLKADSNAAIGPNLPNRQWLLSAAQSGDVQAAIELGFESMTENRPTQALAYFRAVAASSAVASANAALLAEQQRIPSTAPQNASADDLLARAQRNHRGEGQSANYVEAIRLYQLAKNQGNEQAKKMLELIFSRPLANGQIDISWMQHLAYVTYSKDIASLGSSIAPRTLRREPTPLYDLLPLVWRNAAYPVSR